MPRRTDNRLDRLAETRVLGFWAKAAEAVAAMDLGTVRTLRTRARRLQREVGRMLTEADARLATPFIGSASMESPPGTDWEWRPDLWRWPLETRGYADAQNGLQVVPGITLFHDCPLCEIALQQKRNHRPGDLAPFALSIEVFGFEGSYLSVATDLPDAAAKGLSKRHLFSARVDRTTEKSTPIYARLNIKSGPNVEHVLSRLPEEEPAEVAFDLAGTSINEKRVEKLWLDLIFEKPSFNAFTIRDLTMTRRPRADL